MTQMHIIYENSWIIKLYFLISRNETIFIQIQLIYKAFEFLCLFVFFPEITRFSVNH